MTLLESARTRRTQRESCGGVIERLSNFACAVDEEIRRDTPDITRLRALLDAPRNRTLERKLRAMLDEVTA